MKAKVGFYYLIGTYDRQNGSYHQNRLILVVENNYLQFKLIRPELLQNNFNHKELYNNPYSYDYPIIYEEDDNGNIIKIIFLRDIPIIDNSSKKYFPLEKIHLSNVKQKPVEGYSISIQKNYSDYFFCKATLLHNGNDIYKTANKITEFIFYKYILYYFVLQKEILSLQEEEKPINIFDSSLKYIKKIKDSIDTYLNTINLSEILSDLEVTVSEISVYKRGDDNSYYIDRDARVSSLIAYEDEYLRSHIGLGRTTIYSDSGYTSISCLKNYAKDFIEGLYLGMYEGEILEKEKRKIINSYSKESHITYLIARIFSERENKRYYLPKWEKALTHSQEVLLDKFNMSVIFKNRLEFINKIKSFQNIDTDTYNELKKINNYLKKETIFNDEQIPYIVY